MGMTHRRALLAAVLSSVVLSACGDGAGGPDPDESGPADGSPAPTGTTVPPGMMAVAEDRETACEDLLLAADAGEVTLPDRELDGHDVDTVVAHLGLGEEAGVRMVGVTRCGEHWAISVGAASRDAIFPREVEGLPLMVFYEYPISPL